MGIKNRAGAVVAAGVILAGSYAGGYYTNQNGSNFDPQKYGYCGRERADVKHTVDSAASSINTNPVRTTVAKLNSLPVPTGLNGPNTPRLSEEEHVYRIRGAILSLIKSENDGDFHMVLKGVLPPHKTMILESVPPSCASGSPFIDQITTVRDYVTSLQGHLPIRINVTGVGYFDFRHGQTGVADNAIELHPLLSIKTLAPLTLTPSGDPGDNPTP